MLEPPNLELVRGTGQQPREYKVICISIYYDDLEELDAMVEEEKRKGNKGMSRSGMIREALELMRSMKGV